MAKGRKRRRRRGQSTADVAQPPQSHPLGTYGLDWDDDFAFIAGGTSGGVPYGVPWAEATYLLDDPEFAETVREAQRRAAKEIGPSPVPHDADLDRDSSTYEEIPY